MTIKKNMLIYSLIITGFILVFASSCKKDDTSTTPVVPAAITVWDNDSNLYHGVTIGTQVWMVENLKTRKYRNGDAIQNIIDNTAWSNLTAGAYCNYNNDLSNGKTYGRLYNWLAVTDSRKLCPAGWHIATDSDWKKLIEYLGGIAIAGGKLKEKGTTHWHSPNGGATNVSGFTALPSGVRTKDGVFYGLGDICEHWTTSEDIALGAIHYGMGFFNENATTNFSDKKAGYLVRCVRD